jgi:hypothetical protein
MSNPHNQELRIRESFNLFELPVNATKSNIKKKYKTLAKLWHPDLNNSKEAAQKFKKLNDAYNILITYKNQNRFVLKPEDFYLKKSEKDLKKESYRKKIKTQLIAFYKTNPLSISSQKQTRKDYLLININFIFCCIVVFIFPLLLSLTYGWDGLLLSIFLIVFLSLFIMSAIRNLHRTQVFLTIKRLLNR